MNIVARNRTLTRVASVLALAALGFGFTCLRPLSASSPQGQPPAGKPGEKEEHGGDLVFNVVSKTQKYSVLYSHEAHLDKGIECEECHERIFKKKINTNHFKMAEINQGKYCGTCHTESPAPEVKHAAFAPKKNCAKCHNLRIREPDSK